MLAGEGGSLDNQFAHTGFYSYLTAPGKKGFIYRAQIGRDIEVGKTYRVSVWVHANAPAGKLYAASNGIQIGEASRSSSNTKKAGSWYLLTLLVTIPTTAQGQTVEFGCLNAGATSGNFDDFRLSPLTATVTSKVYDPRTNNVLYSLDNDNLFTHYEYTPTGRLKRVYQEVLDGPGTGNMVEHLVKEYAYNYAMLNAPTWVTAAYRCTFNAQGNSTGYEERQVVDVNPLNNPPTASRWEGNGMSAACAAPTCPFTDSSIPYRLHNNVWEQAQPTGSPTCQSCGIQNNQQTFMWLYHWVYANGDDAGDTTSGCTLSDCSQLTP